MARYVKRSKGLTGTDYKILKELAQTAFIDYQIKVSNNWLGKGMTSNELRKKLNRNTVPYVNLAKLKKYGYITRIKRNYYITKNGYTLYRRHLILKRQKKWINKKR